ncbi:MAG: RNA-binding protein [Candidatus Riflebacteria bacterium HGW-Riflebacteria-1]|jgi:ribosome-associated protein|nr:MAG: RNA-binding protein [Candidatus Riflebacteria bacterium HGW-Riflebacteria-1]
MSSNKPLTFELTEDFIELIKLLKFVGICQTGGQAKLAVENGLVKVDGEVESRKRRKLRKGMRVEIEGQTVLVV